MRLLKIRKKRSKPTKKPARMVMVMAMVIVSDDGA